MSDDRLNQRMNEEAKSVEVFNLTKSSDVFRLLSETVEMPKELEPVIAKIAVIGELGKSSWYEVVYHNGDEWCCYAGSKTFQDGERVLDWKYCTDVL
ncbi:hypothetical protein pEaSNUABM47_00151 [Erwinia phage pEa_SNUABM_47]|uniref:Uncharacterized protein n=2 Tax=Eneladusvirus BF TaxID=2560751 RepID=A0A7L8ZMC9_9CAUD|nr:hypothetical protein pEaSNUABM12_00152 [Erwinia phage pEa_SNUABM_12]QOI71635.1 hypothetical protein pEaSNUABM47_00151 [Erwinia phage pEa_SNUABM_47]QXO11848.1 hypothetical protein pEaSNUABM44_00152 [Erwinia phage pEa_SNUABM_44]